VSDALRYRLVDEPRPWLLSRLALPPLLVFMVAVFFNPWGYLLLVFNAVALNGPRRNREIGLALLPFPIDFGTFLILDTAVRGGALTVGQAHYVFSLAIALGMVCAAFAYVSQAHAFDLRQYLAQPGGRGR
jgi:hypothetical protein